jgi:hypothetical protein
MSGATVLGVLLAAASACFNGSFGALSKVDAIQRAAVTPLHFNSWVAVGLILSTLPLLAVDQASSPACNRPHQCCAWTCSSNAVHRLDWYRDAGLYTMGHAFRGAVRLEYGMYLLCYRPVGCICCQRNLVRHGHARVVHLGLEVRLSSSCCLFCP